MLDCRLQKVIVLDQGDTRQCYIEALLLNKLSLWIKTLHRSLLQHWESFWSEGKCGRHARGSSGTKANLRAVRLLDMASLDLPRTGGGAVLGTVSSGEQDTVDIVISSS